MHHIHDIRYATAALSRIHTICPSTQFTPYTSYSQYIRNIRYLRHIRYILSAHHIRQVNLHMPCAFFTLNSISAIIRYIRHVCYIHPCGWNRSVYPCSDLFFQLLFSLILFDMFLACTHIAKSPNTTCDLFKSIRIIQKTQSYSTEVRHMIADIYKGNVELSKFVSKPQCLA